MQNGLFVDLEAWKRYRELRKNFVTDTALAEHLGVARTTMTTWFDRGLASKKGWRMVNYVLRDGIKTMPRTKLQKTPTPVQ